MLRCGVAARGTRARIPSYPSTSAFRESTAIFASGCSARERKTEARAASDHGVEHDVPAVTLHRRVHHREPEASPRVAFRREAGLGAFEPSSSSPIVSGSRTSPSTEASNPRAATTRATPLPPISTRYLGAYRQYLQLVQEHFDRELADPVAARDAFSSVQRMVWAVH